MPLSSRVVVLTVAALCLRSSLDIYTSTREVLFPSWMPTFVPAPPATVPQRALDNRNPSISDPTTAEVPYNRTKNSGFAITTWAGSNKTSQADLLKSELNCYKPDNNYHRLFKTCHCYNCCIQDKMVYVFDINDTSTTPFFTNITSQYMTALENFGIFHAGRASALQEPFIDSPMVETPVHYTSISRQHILALWLWNADVWSTWQAEGWSDKKFGPFHWLLMNTIVRNDRDYLTNFMFANNHPSTEAPVSLDDEDSNRKVCYRHLMIGHHHTGERLYLNTIVRHPLGINTGPIYGIDRHVTSLLSRYRDFFVEKTGLTRVALDPKKAILISRKDSKKRRILNEKELVSVMEQEGFNVEEVVFSELPLEESNKKIRSAAVVFGSHGAGFANIMACQNSTAVIETHPWGFQKYGYAHLAKILGLDYRYWLAPDESFTKHTEESLKYNEKHQDFYRHRDYRVDVNEFRAIVKDIKRQATT